jgi:hypothetical protein
MTDDDWDWYEPVSLMMGSAQAGGGAIEEGNDPLDLRATFLYVPDLTARMGYSVHRVRDRTPIPQARARRPGFRMRRRR